MSDQMQILIIVLLILLGVGFIFLLLRSILRQVTKPTVGVNQKYLVGLNHLLNEEPDKAVDVFIKLLAINDNTIETHLALGKLFRKRGEVDRAIKIHRHLLEREGLAPGIRCMAIMALGQDYLKAGVLDRAEHMFKEVIQYQANNVDAWLNLLDIYQQEKEWSLVIEVGKRLIQLGHKEMSTVVAQAYCEVAEWRLQRDENEAALYALQQALSAHRQCVRANLIFANLLAKQQQFTKATQKLKRVVEQNPSFLSEIIAIWIHCCTNKQRMYELFEYLVIHMDCHPQLPIYLFLLEHVSELSQHKELVVALNEHLQRWPSVAGLSLFLTLQQPYQREHMALIQSAQVYLQRLMLNHHTHQCVRCGFSSKHIHWQCPGCRRWETIRAIHISATKPI